MSLGEAIIRKDGDAKITGSAQYAADQQPGNLLHAIVIQSPIAAGRIVDIDVTKAATLPGVMHIFTHHDFPRLRHGTHFPFGSLSQSYLPLQDELIGFYGQHIALVIGETLHEAVEGARQVSLELEPAPFAADLGDPNARAVPPTEMRAPPWAKADEVRGDPDAALGASPVVIEACYTTPRQQHCPIEPHGTVASWDEEAGFTIWEPTQWPEGVRAAVAEWLAVPIELIRVISPYIGGGFGGKVEPHPHVALACAAAQALGRPVKLILTRPQTFACHGPRPATRQRLMIGADHDGRINAVVHENVNDTGADEHFIEGVGRITKFSYAIPNLHIRQRLVEVNMVAPTTLRAPGYSLGAFALESALDELSHALSIDPIELRLRNYAEADPDTGKPWSTRRLREAYQAGADAFGWKRRNPAPRSMRHGNELIGWGMAGGAYPVYVTPAEISLCLRQDGRVEVQTSGTDLGTGTYTILAQTVAEILGVRVEHVNVKLGDTAGPRAPFTAGSQHANTVTAAGRKVALDARDALLRLAAGEAASPLYSARFNDLSIADGQITANGRPVISIGALLAATGHDTFAIISDTMPEGRDGEAERATTFRTATRTVSPNASYTICSWCAQFAEVRVDEDLGTVRVNRLVGAFDCGRLYNPRLARSQWEGGMIMGLGAALLEGLEIDRRHGRAMNNNLADYLLPVASDIPEIEAISVGEPDFVASPLGGKTVGEIGIIGTAAAIANAVFHATGKRIRDLPIRLESLL